MAIVRYTSEELDLMEDQSDIERVLSMKDEDIPHDADSPTLSELLASGKEVRTVRMGRPPVAEPKEKVTIRVDQAALRILRASGKGWQTRLSEQISKWVASGML